MDIEEEETSQKEEEDCASRICHSPEQKHEEHQESASPHHSPHYDHAAERLQCEREREQELEREREYESEREREHDRLDDREHLNRHREHRHDKLEISPGSRISDDIKHRIDDLKESSEKDRDIDRASNHSTSSSPNPSDDSKSKEHTSPPNVTVIQPSVNHPMFSYLYHPGAAGLYSGGSPSIPFHMGHMFMGGNMSSSSGLSLPFGPPTTLADLSHISSSAAAAAAAAAGLSGVSANMVLNSQLALAAGHPMWPPGYFGHPATMESSVGAHLPSASHMGSLFAPRATHRYSPYQLPLTKTTMVTTSAPLPATGVTSPLMTSADLRTCSPSPVKSHPPTSPSSRSSPPTTILSQNNASATSELKNIERMVNGLERQQEQLAAESLAKLGDK